MIKKYLIAAVLLFQSLSLSAGQSSGGGLAALMSRTDVALEVHNFEAVREELFIKDLDLLTSQKSQRFAPVLMTDNAIVLKSIDGEQVVIHQVNSTELETSGQLYFDEEAVVLEVSDES